MNSNLRLIFPETLSGERFSIESNMNNEPDQNDLRKLLSRLPDTPVPSNFTARVMQAVEREESQAARSRGWRWNWHALLPRVAVATVMVAAAGFAFYQHEIYNRRAEIAKSVSLVAQSQPLPSVEALQDFYAIQRMSQPAHADEGLLALASDLK